MYRAGEEPRSLTVNWDVALLSSAAWQTAQLTSSAPYMGLERVVDLAEVYEFQRFYLAMQDDLVRRISGIEARIETEPVATLIELRSQFAMALGLRRTLATIYACTPGELEGPEVEEAGECPEIEEGERIRLDSAG